MKICKVILQDKTIFEIAYLATSFKDRLFGLSFKKSFEGALIFPNAFWIHSFFVFFKFNAFYLNKDFEVIAHHKNIRPFSVLPPVWGACYIIEYGGEPLEEIKAKGKVELRNC